MKKVKLAEAKSKSYAKTATDRETEALISDSYKDYLWGSLQVDAEFYLLDNQKSQVETEIDVLRSLLSFHKEQINRTT